MGGERLGSPLGKHVAHFGTALRDVFGGAPDGTWAPSGWTFRPGEQEPNGSAERELVDSASDGVPAEGGQGLVPSSDPRDLARLDNAMTDELYREIHGRDRGEGPFTGPQPQIRINANQEVRQFSETGAPGEEYVDQILFRVQHPKGDPSRTRVITEGETTVVAWIQTAVVPQLFIEAMRNRKNKEESSPSQEAAPPTPSPEVARALAHAGITSDTLGLHQDVAAGMFRPPDPTQQVDTTRAITRGGAREVPRLRTDKRSPEIRRATRRKGWKHRMGTAALSLTLFAIPPTVVGLAMRETLPVYGKKMSAKELCDIHNGDLPFIGRVPVISKRVGETIAPNGFVCLLKGDK